MKCQPKTFSVVCRYRKPNPNPNWKLPNITENNLGCFQWFSGKVSVFGRLFRLSFTFLQFTSSFTKTIAKYYKQLRLRRTGSILSCQQTALLQFATLFRGHLAVWTVYTTEFCGLRISPLADWDSQNISHPRTDCLL